MKNLSIILLIISLFLIVSCGNKKETSPKPEIKTDTIEKPKDSIIVESTFSIMDNLNKYSNADSIRIESTNPRGSLCIGKANECSFAAWLPETSDTMVFYEKVNGEWQSTDSVNSLWSFFDFDCMDLNGDHYKDIRIRSYSNSGGNFDNLVFLFNAKSKTFKHNPDYDLPNITYDSTGKFIKSFWFNGVLHCQDKKKYRISGNHLIMEGGVTYCPNREDEGETATIEYYYMKGDKEIVTKKLEGTSEKMWKRFETALWDSKKEWGE